MRDFKLPSNYYDPPDPEGWWCSKCNKWQVFESDEDDTFLCDACGAEFLEIPVQPHSDYCPECHKYSLESGFETLENPSNKNFRLTIKFWYCTFCYAMFLENPNE